MKVTVRKLRINAQGYVVGGAFKGRYFGAGDPVYFCPQVHDLYMVDFGHAFFRAAKRESALAAAQFRYDTRLSQTELIRARMESHS